jgi:hypothetical protein
MTGPKQRFGSRISRPLEHSEDENTARIRDFHAGIDASTGYLREDSAAIDRCTVITTVRSSEHVRSAAARMPRRALTSPLAVALARAPAARCFAPGLSVARSGERPSSRSDGEHNRTRQRRPRAS